MTEPHSTMAEQPVPSPDKFALVARLSIAVLAITIMIGGHIDQILGGIVERQFDSTFYIWLTIDLIPPLLLAIAVRRLKTALICGGVLIGLNTVPWALWIAGSVGALEFVVTIQVPKGLPRINPHTSKPPVSADRASNCAL